MTLRSSRYLLVSPRRYRDRQGQERRLAYATRTASLFAVDPPTADRLTTGVLDGIAADDLADLAALRAVVDTDEDELATVLAGYRAGSTDGTVRSFCIMPTSYCNMACAYCGQEHVKAPVDRERLERTAARVATAFADPTVGRVNVVWFGGEPMLALRVVQELSARFVAAAEATGTSYTAQIVTNGSLLTRRTLRVLHDECRVALEVTLDGPEAVHDRRRLKRNGIGSFRRTVETLAEAVRDRTVPGMPIGIRMNIDRENEDHVADLIIDLACAGLADPQVELHLMPVHSWSNDVSAVQLAGRRYGELQAGWFRLAQSLGLRFRGVPNVVKRTTCRATTVFSELIDQQGRVYSCSEQPLVPALRDTTMLTRVDRLAAGDTRPVGRYDDWYDRIGSGDQQCARCPLLPVCGGACPKAWQDGYVPCPSIKHNWEELFDIVAPGLGLWPTAS